jgi:hypothetical protein
LCRCSLSKERWFLRLYSQSDCRKYDPGTKKKRRNALVEIVATTIISMSLVVGGIYGIKKFFDCNYTSSESIPKINDTANSN